MSLSVLMAVRDFFRPLWADVLDIPTHDMHNGKGF